jgi:hypothetical protein
LVLCGKKLKYLDKGLEKLESSLDIANLLQRLLEVEKLKHFLLNENQIKLFEYIPKPMLQLQNDNPTQFKRIDYFLNETEFTQKMKNALASYKLLKESRDIMD